jgi:hypothetical protein
MMKVFFMEKGPTQSTINRIGFVGNCLPRQCGIAAYPPADLTIKPIGDLVNCGLPALLVAFKTDPEQ